MLKEAINEVKIEGILSEVDLNDITFTKNGEEKEAIGGRITIRVNDGNKTLDVPVHMFSTKLTKAGNPNPAYANILKIKNEMTSIAASGDGTGDYIRINNGKITMNEFHNQSGALISQPRIQASFVSKIRADECKPCATFAAEFAIANIGPETTKSGEETERLKIMAIIPQFGGKVDVVPFFVENKKAIDAISTYWTPGSTVKAVGKLNFSFTTETIVEEMDFGEPIEKTVTKSVSEFIITGGTQAPYDEANEFNPDEIKTALNERQNRLEAQKERDMSKAKTKATPTPANNATAQKGFDLGF